MRNFEIHINNTITYINVKTLFIKNNYKLHDFQKRKKNKRCKTIMYKLIHHYKIVLQQYSPYVHAKQKLRKSDPFNISLLLYSRIAEVHGWVLQIIWRRIQ